MTIRAHPRAIEHKHHRVPDGRLLAEWWGRAQVAIAPEPASSACGCRACAPIAKQLSLLEDGYGVSHTSLACNRESCALRSLLPRLEQCLVRAGKAETARLRPCAF